MPVDAAIREASDQRINSQQQKKGYENLENLDGKFFHLNAADFVVFTVNTIFYVKGKINKENQYIAQLKGALKMAQPRSS